MWRSILLTETDPGRILSNIVADRLELDDEKRMRSSPSNSNSLVPIAFMRFNSNGFELIAITTMVSGLQWLGSGMCVPFAARA